MNHSQAPKLADPLSPVFEALRIVRFALNRRRRGKIAALPESTREQINSMLEDGVPYTHIIARLGEAGKNLSEDCLCRWRRTFFQDWRQARFQTVNSPKTETEQHIADTASVLAGFDPAVLAPIINRDGTKFAPLVKAIARIAELSLTFESEPQQSTPIHTNSDRIADKFSPRTIRAVEIARPLAARNSRNHEPQKHGDTGQTT